MEEDKVEALSKGNHKAFEDLFIAYFQRVKLFICGIVKSEADAEELAQDVFVRLWTNREAINIEKPLGGYLYTIARNTAFNFLKHKLVEQSYVDSFSFSGYLVFQTDSRFYRPVVV